MAGFKLVCGKCGSLEVLEKSAEDKREHPGGYAIYLEGVQRKCLDCSNEDFVVFKSLRQGKKD